MKRMLLVLLALIMALCCVNAGLGEEAAEELHLTDYDAGETVWSLLSSAEYALEEGMPGKQVLEEMYALADEGDFLEQFEATCENIAAYGNKTYEALTAFLEGEEEYNPRAMDVIYSIAAEDYDRSWSAYDCPEVSDELRELLKNSKAQYCFTPSYWPEEDFKKGVGETFSKFKPSRSRPGYACVVIKKGAQCAPETVWNKEDADNYEFLDEMSSLVNTIVADLGDDGPVFTGNPHLASTFWVFNVSYEFYTWYGNKEVKGYDLEMTLTIEDASSKKDLAKIKYTERLGSTIYSWEDGVARPDFPYTDEITGLDATISKIRALLVKQRAEAAANRKITGANAEKILNGVLSEQAGKLEDAWQKAIYLCGVHDVELDGDTINFTLRSYNPDPASLGAYSKAEDQSAWLDMALENAARYDIQASLILEDGQPTSKSLNELKKVVKAAAKVSQEAFEGKDMSAAIIDRMFPEPVSEKVTKAQQVLSPDEAFVSWLRARSDYRLNGQEPAEIAALFASHKSKTLDTKNGPTGLVLKLTAPKPEELLSDASKAVLDELAFLDAEDRDTDDLSGQLCAAVAEAALSAKKNTKNKYEIPLNLDLLMQDSFSSEYWAYIEAYTFNDARYQLSWNLDDLPSVAAQPMPKSGIIRGGKSGTEVTLKLSKNSNPTYVQVRTDDTDEMAATVFINPGKSVTLHLKKGYYRLYYCSGLYWYGEEDLFGGGGNYNKSEATEIKGTNYTHTITLESSADGNVSYYDSDPSEFLKP